MQHNLGYCFAVEPCVRPSAFAWIACVFIGAVQSKEVMIEFNVFCCIWARLVSESQYLETIDVSWEDLLKSRGLSIT